MNSCRYDRPRTTEQAVEFLVAAEGEAHLIAGGVALGILMNENLIEPSWLIDISRLEGLKRVERREDGGLRIGALASHRHVERSQDVLTTAPLLIEMYHEVACQRIKNRGTIGGNICLGDPQADPPVALIALNAIFIALGPNGRREIPARKFFEDLYTTALLENEILTEILVPATPTNSGTTYAKFGARKAMDYSSTISVAVQLVCGPEDGVIVEAGLGLGGVDVKPVWPETTAKLLCGSKPSPEFFDQLREVLKADIAPLGDHLYSAEYKLHVVGTMLKRAVQVAYERAIQAGNSGHEC